MLWCQRSFADLVFACLVHEIHAIVPDVISLVAGCRYNHHRIVLYNDGWVFFAHTIIFYLKQEAVFSRCKDCTL